MNKPLLPKGHSSILSPGFRYVPAANTDIAKTFARVKRELKREEHPIANVSIANVSVLKARKTN